MNRYKAVNKKNGEKIYFDDGDMHNAISRPEWQDTAIWVIDDPEDPDSLNNLMLLKKTYDIYTYVEGQWMEFN